MADGITSDASENQSEATDEQNDKSMADNMYDTMDDKSEGDKGAEGNAETKDTEDGKKPDDSGAEDKSVEDDDLLGINDDKEGDDKSADEADDKNADDKKSDDDKGDDANEESKAPEDYKLQVSEESLLGSDAAKHAEEYAKKHGLSQEAAEGHLQAKEDAVKEYQEFLDREAPARNEAAVKVHKAEWLAEAKADADIGGDMFNETVARASTYLKTYGTPEDIQVMKASGMGNHKTLLRLLSRGASHLMDDNIDLDTSVEDGEQGFLDELYPLNEMKGQIDGY